MIITVAGMPQSGSTLLFNIVTSILRENGIDYETYLYGPVSNNKVIDYHSLMERTKTKLCVIKEHHFQEDLSKISDIILISKRDIRDSIASRRRRGKGLASKGKRHRGLHKYDENTFLGFTKWCEYLTKDCIDDWMESCNYVFDYEMYCDGQKKINMIEDISKVLSHRPTPDVQKIISNMSVSLLSENGHFFSKDKITGGGKRNNFKDQLTSKEIQYIEDNYEDYIKKNDREPNRMENVVFKPYKDDHKGERVFLIANGPSLAHTNLDLLKDETTIAMNRISLMYDKFSWRPTYYLFSSTNVKNSVWGKEWTQSVIDSVQEEETTSFISSQFRENIDPEDKFHQILWFDSMTETKPNLNGDISENCFSTDVVERIDKSGTTMNLALQLVYHMGFSEIVLVGADLGWTKDTGSTNDPNHFDPSYRADISRPEKTNNQMRNIHSLAYKKLLEKDQDIKVYNASVDTVLDVYPIINFAKYMDGDLVYETDRLNEAKRFWKSAPQFFKGRW